MTVYRVTAPYVQLRISDPTTGKVVINGFYAQAIVTSNVEEVSLKRHLDRGWLEVVAESPPEPVVPEPVVPGPDAPPPSGADEAPAGDESGDDGQAPAKPSQGDQKAVWVDYAVTRGIDRVEADAMTKADLIELLK